MLSFLRPGGFPRLSCGISRVSSHASTNLPLLLDLFTPQQGALYPVIVIRAPHGGSFSLRCPFAKSEFRNLAPNRFLRSLCPSCSPPHHDHVYRILVVFCRHSHHWARFLDPLQIQLQSSRPLGSLYPRKLCMTHLMSYEPNHTRRFVASILARDSGPGGTSTHPA